MGASSNAANDQENRLRNQVRAYTRPPLSPTPAPAPAPAPADLNVRHPSRNNISFSGGDEIAFLNATHNESGSSSRSKAVDEINSGVNDNSAESISMNSARSLSSTREAGILSVVNTEGIVSGSSGIRSEVNEDENENDEDMDADANEDDAFFSASPGPHTPLSSEEDYDYNTDGKSESDDAEENKEYEDVGGNGNDAARVKDGAAIAVYKPHVKKLTEMNENREDMLRPKQPRTIDTIDAIDGSAAENGKTLRRRYPPNRCTCFRQIVYRRRKSPRRQGIRVLCCKSAGEFSQSAACHT